MQLQEEDEKFKRIIGEGLDVKELHAEMVYESYP